MWLLARNGGAEAARSLVRAVEGDDLPRLAVTDRAADIPEGPAFAVAIPRKWIESRHHNRRYNRLIVEEAYQHPDWEYLQVQALATPALPVGDPGVAFISRDRTGFYAEAARTGAPGAVQAADRRHLLVNASDAPLGVPERHQAKLREVARLCATKGKALAAPSKPARPGAEPLPRSTILVKKRWRRGWTAPGRGGKRS